MNSTYTFYTGLRLTRDPKVRTVGSLELVEVTVAVNPFGKSKDRYTTKWVSATFSGPQAERLKALTKGAVISFRGTEEVREYNGKLYHEVPYAEGLTVHGEGAPAPAPAPAADPPNDIDPFA